MRKVQTHFLVDHGDDAGSYAHGTDVDVVLILCGEERLEECSQEHPCGIAEAPPVRLLTAHKTNQEAETYKIT